MKSLRLWIAVAILAGSWMFGLGYFYPAERGVWLAMLAVGAILLYGTAIPLPDGRAKWLAPLLLLPPAIWTPWPYTIVPIFLLGGLLFNNIPTSRQWPKSLARGIVAAGGVLLIQALALAVYAAQTARSHELPWPLPNFLASVARLFSIDAAFDGVNIVFRTMRQTHRLAPTWELLLDPVSLSFLVGGLFLIGMKIAGEWPPGGRWQAWIRCMRILAVVFLVWLPVRAVLLIAIYIERAIIFDPGHTPYVMNHIFAPWPLMLYSIVPALLAWRFVRIKISPLPLGKPEHSTINSFSRPFITALLLSAFAAVFYTLALEWSPVGGRRQGRVAFVERHSEWEPTFLPKDVPSLTAWHGENGSYNYTAIYDYLGQFYEMSRLMEEGKIDDAALEKCEVLVIKTPTARYSDDEVAAVLKFVRRGGGLLFIGDHTNLDGMATTMNDMARPMGFIFRDDLLFSNERTKIRRPEDISRDVINQSEPTSPDERTCYHQRFDPPWPRHPALSYMPPMEFAVSCSIDPGSSDGRAAIAGAGLWSMPPEYHTENYHPIPQHCAPMRYGAFVQLWAAYYGDGRAMAFTDSTIFSDFCIYQPGKAELMLGMIEWLNHGNPPIYPRPWLMLLGTGLLAALVWYSARHRFAPETFVCFIAAAMAGWIFACGATAFLHRAAMPMPVAKNPMIRAVVDRTASIEPLSMGAYVKGENGSGFGLLEQWISRPKFDGRSCYTVRGQGAEAFSGDVLVVICPTEPVSDDYRVRLLEFVERGGKLLVFDSPDYGYSTANELLDPFNIVFNEEQTISGTLTMADRWPGIQSGKAEVVWGGEIIARIDGRPVAAVKQAGKGTVMAIGFGSLFNDLNMGGTWAVEPDSNVKRRYNVLFSLLRSLIEGKPVEPTREAFGNLPLSDIPPAKPGKTERAPSRDLPDLPAQELGPDDEKPSPAG
jgi:hypothetical protein